MDRFNLKMVRRLGPGRRGKSLSKQPKGEENSNSNLQLNTSHLLSLGGGSELISLPYIILFCHTYRSESGVSTCSSEVKSP